MDEATSGDFDMINEISKLTDEALRQDPASLRNSPIPTIVDVSRIFGTEEEINKYLNSDKISDAQINIVSQMAQYMTNKIVAKYPNIKNRREEIWKESFKQVLIAGLPKTGGRKRRKRISVPKRYVPKQLSKKDKKKQSRELKKSRRAYKKGKYHTRKKMKSFKSKVSPHIIKARKMYKVDKITPNKKLAKACGCKMQGLRKIVKKGQGAYFSSGSRPNQTGHSWGYARMASAITGGKAAGVDYNILEKYCKKNSKALKLAKKMRGKGTRRVKQVKIGGRRRTRKY